ncbi:MAG: PAQR family membrane homeostasis protein TrhA [Myxococcota bacterium]
MTTAPQKPAKVKPRWRGSFHAMGFFASLFGIAELAMSPTEGWRYAAGLVYATSLTLMLGLSGLYHRPMWSHAARNRLRMADHVGVFFLIAGTYTPFAALISPHAPTFGLIGMWLGAVAGIIYALVNSHGHRAIRAGIYVVLGLSSLPMILGLPTLIGWPRTWVLLVASAVYILGAGVYARRWPNPNPNVFGYHEVFHAMVLVAAGMHFGVVWSVQQLA